MIVFVASRKYCVALLGFSSSLGSASTTSTSVRSTWSFSKRFAGLQDAPRPWIGSWLCGGSSITGRYFRDDRFFITATPARNYVHMNVTTCRACFAVAAAVSGGSSALQAIASHNPRGWGAVRVVLAL